MIAAECFAAAGTAVSYQSSALAALRPPDSVVQCSLQKQAHKPMHKGPSLPTYTGLLLTSD
jgi:hypothetical protein